jgi:hypothetical protein
MSLVRMQNQFSGLPMGQLIGGPLTAACNSQLKLAKSTADFIEQIGFYDDSGVSKTRTADFSFDRNLVTGKDALGNDIHEEETVKLSVPMLAIVNIPSLMIDAVDIIFDMEVKSSESHSDSVDTEASLSGCGGVGWGPISASVSFSGCVSAHSENTRKSDNAAKYHVQVHAADSGTPEGLSRVLDIIAASVAPSAVEGPQARKDKQIMSQLEGPVREKERLTHDLNMKKLELNNKRKELELIKGDEKNADEAATEKSSKIKGEIPGMIDEHCGIQS